MRLLTKTTLYFFTALVVLLGATGFYLFHQFSKQLNNRSDKELLADESAWIDYLETDVPPGTTFILKTREVAVYPVNTAPTEYPVIGDAPAGGHMPYRQLSQVVLVDGIPYQIIIKKSQEQKAALVAGFTRVMLLVFAGLFLVTIIFNWIISRSLWAPFQSSLQKIRNTELSRIQAIHFEKTNTKEFTDLNTSLNYMTTRIHQDFVNMKEFTENAAHEMQTPIAVVQSKMELLLQDNNLNEGQLQSVAEASAALSRLGKLNQGLLLLAKIENSQYEATEEISFAAASKKYLRLFNELVKDKQITISTDLDADFRVLLHPLLADSLISNLLGNAIKYNYSGGAINIETSPNRYQVSNSSQLGAIPADKLFKRFSGSKNQQEPSTGLGLSIVKKIADMNGLQARYHAENNMHYFTITKKGPQK